MQHYIIEDLDIFIGENYEVLQEMHEAEDRDIDFNLMADEIFTTGKTGPRPPHLVWDIPLD